ncbi:hypothetical protein SLE2022_406270 [Rubroshorea leprosula]
MVSGIKVNKMNLSRRSLVLFNIKAREMTLVTGVGYSQCAAAGFSLLAVDCMQFDRFLSFTFSVYLNSVLRSD